MKLVEKKLGPHHVAADIGCHLFSIMPPFNIGATTMGYGLGPASNSAFNVEAGKRPIAVMGDGGFWHNGLASGVGNAVFNKQDGVILVVDNHYSAATGGQDILSSRADNKRRSTKHPIEDAIRGLGGTWVKRIDRTYDVGKMRDALTEALTTTEKGPKFIVASSECMLNRQRREKPLVAKAIGDGKRVVKSRFGVDEDVCTGDHACIRLSGCPSLVGEEARRSLARRSRRGDRQHLRRLRQLRRGRRCRGALPVLLSRRCHPQSELARSHAREVAREIRHLASGPPVGAAPGAFFMTRKFSEERDIIKLAILAIGGQGGGVLADWIVHLAEANGYYAQTTSVPGVAQRTGATIYYLELVPETGRTPVLSLMPAPGDVDIVIAAELMEAGRAIMRGFVTPNRTTLIASAHRAYAVSEKMAPGDGIADASKVLDIARQASHRLIAFDMESIAARNGSVISASLFGALAGSRALPFSRESFEETIRAGGKGMEASLKAFSAACDAVSNPPPPMPEPEAAAHCRP